MGIYYNEICLAKQRTGKVYDQGLVGHNQGFKGDFGGADLTEEQGIQALTNDSILASNPGHQTKLRAMAFMPGCSA